MYNKYLAELSKEQLLELIELYAKNWAWSRRCTIAFTAI